MTWIRDYSRRWLENGSPLAGEGRKRTRTTHGCVSVPNPQIRKSRKNTVRMTDFTMTFCVQAARTHRSREANRREDQRAVHVPAHGVVTVVFASELSLPVVMNQVMTMSFHCLTGVLDTVHIILSCAVEASVNCPSPFPP